MAARPDAAPDVRARIDQEIRNIQSGVRGESDAAYQMDFYFKDSKTWMIVHDLRLECGGRVAQIDHLLINRFMQIYVCESKSIIEGVSINELGEFVTFFRGQPRGIPSPIEQNRRHMTVLEAVFKSGQVAPPRRLGFNRTPTLFSLILVSKNARISRPKAHLPGLDTIIKSDQLKARVERDIEADNNALVLAKMIATDTLQEFAERLAEDTGRFRSTGRQSLACQKADRGTRDVDASAQYGRTERLPQLRYPAPRRTTSRGRSRNSIARHVDAESHSTSRSFAGSTSRASAASSIAWIARRRAEAHMKL